MHGTTNIKCTEPQTLKKIKDNSNYSWLQTYQLINIYSVFLEN